MTEPTFELDLDTLDGGVELTLRWDGNTRSHEVRLADHRLALWEGVFDTHAFLGRYAGSTLFTDAPSTPEDLLRELGLFVGRHVLGEEITGVLADGNYRRTLVVRLPPTTEDPDPQSRGLRRRRAGRRRDPWQGGAAGREKE